MTSEGHSHAERRHRIVMPGRLERSVVVTITKALYSHTVVVRDPYAEAPLWNGDFSDPCTRHELSELAYGAGQAGFDPKAVLLPLGRLQKHPTKQMP